MPMPGSVRDRVVVVTLVVVLLGGLIVAAVIDRAPVSKVGSAQSEPPASSSAPASSEPGTSSSIASLPGVVVPGSSTPPASTSASSATASSSSASPSLAKPTSKPKPKPKPTPKPTATPTPTPKPTPSPSVPEPPGKPGPTNTGVPPGTKLTVVHGTVTVTKPGTVIDSQDIKGQLIIQASNVTVKRSLIEGAKGQDASVDIQSGSNILIEDSEVTDTYPSLGNDDMRVKGATLLRMNIHGGVDGMKLFSNSTVSASWIHGLTYFAHDPGQANGHTHNDTIQILGGSNFHVTGNWLQSATMDNSAIQVTQSIGKISSLFISGNWADGGGCSFNFSGHNGAGKELPLNGITVVANRFGHTSAVYKGNCAIVDTPATHLVSSIGNVWDTSGTPVKIYS
jgi:hypothetical protein